jgi:hypothetical protein
MVAMDNKIHHESLEYLSILKYLYNSLESINLMIPAILLLQSY